MQKQAELLFAIATDAKHPGQSVNQGAVFAVSGVSKNGFPYGLFVVADGVGGLKESNRASQTTISKLAAHFEPIWPRLTAVSEELVTGLKGELKKAIYDAHETILAMSNGDDDRMASTISCALLVGNIAIIANAGDSRTYLYRQKQLEQVTSDHSLVAWLVQQERITAEQALTHPYGNVLTQAVGAEEKLKVDLYGQRLYPGDWLLLCSDGIWGTLRDEMLADFLQTAVSPQQISPIIMEAAQDNSDDLSLILVQLPLTK
ncbi:Protein serine/threonine phosphatase PrpC, regulation of stationary phase [hydrothermal vent metagenome]|uniref:Protein serine/threonine phosphatase PrpC, regulation of stationary phase n=1 Tax=hydrothermal vent metagenome TaxID=652676 RepID=A0A3B0VVB9_9ZZZZ